MHKLSFLAFVGTLALFTGGCNPSGGGGETTSSPSPNNSPTAQTPAAQTFPGSVVPGKPAQTTADATKQPSPTAAVPAPPSDLIQSTNPNSRLQSVQRGATDPFAQPPIQLENTTPPAPTPGSNRQPVPNVRRITGTESTPGINVPTRAPQTRTNGQAAPSVGGRRLPRTIAQRSAPRAKVPPAVAVETPNRPKAPEPFALQAPRRRTTSSRLSIPLDAPSRPNAGEPFSLTSSRGFVARGINSPATRRPTPRPLVLRQSRRFNAPTPVAVQPQRRITTARVAAATPSRNPISRARAVARTAQQTPVTRRTTTVASAPSRRVTTRTTTVATTPSRRVTPRTTTVARTPQRHPARTTTVARTSQRTTAANTRVAVRPTTSPSPTAANVAPSTTATPSAAPTVSPTPMVAPEPQIPALPPPPEPTLARAVEVSGVVQIGNEPQAIVKAPNEATSRYVRVGQRLSQGQVLVKRIEVNEGSEPVVILEENGIEVAKLVGDRPAAPAQPGTPTAAVTVLLAAGGMAIKRSLSRHKGV